MSEIKPALMEEEWVAWLNDGAKVPEMVDACYFDVFGGRAKDGSRHTQAAVALYNQPFGFTREDVEDERETAAELQRLAESSVGTVMDDDRAPRLFARAAHHRDRADRIEALLPQEEK